MPSPTNMPPTSVQSTPKSGTPGKRARPGWGRAVLAGAVAIVGLALVVLLSRWLRTLGPVQDFLTTYPGQPELPTSAPLGLPAWLGWQHFFNAFLILLIVRSGWLVRTNARSKANWTRNNRGLIKTKNPPKKISLDLWFHLSLDALWVLNGIVFFIMLFATGQWLRIVPTGWDVFPNALSAALQYASLDWPMESGWTSYNALQLLSYFMVVFVAAPLAIATGLRMSSAWPQHSAGLNRVYPIEVARALHFPTMLFFVLFIVVHVVLVLTTGALRNLNHMYAARDETDWLGFWMFAGSLALMSASWFLARPLFLRPIANLTGKVTR